MRKASRMEIWAEPFREAALIVVKALQDLQANSAFVVGAARGVGVTTTTVELGRQIAALHELRVLLVDLGATPGDLLSRLNVNATEPASENEDLHVRNIGPAIDLVVPSDGGNGRRPSLLRKVLAKFESAYDVVLVDLPPLLESADTLAAAALAPRAVVVVEAGSTRYEVVDRMRRDLARHGVSVLCGVLNKRRRYVPGWLYRALLQ